MKEMQKEAEELIAQCDENLANGTENSFGSYDEGVRDALMWLFEGGHIPYIGREG